MDLAFRKTLRGAVVLILLTGVALIIYAVSTEGPGESRRRQPTRIDVPSAPRDAAAHPAPPQPVHAAPEPAPEGPSAADVQDVAEPEAGPEPEPEPGPEPENGLREDMEVEAVNWRMPLRNAETGEEEGAASGEVAVLRNGVFYVTKPLLDMLLKGVQVNADDGELDEGQGVYVLYGNVTARGEDFAMSTSNVRVDWKQQSLSSEDEVVIEKLRTDDDDNAVPALRVTGKGLRFDLATKTMTILQDGHARLFNVADDFLAAELVQTPGEDRTSGEEQTREVVISSRGKMIYEHIARKVTFNDAVRAVSAGKELECDELTIQLGGAAEDEQDLAVTEIAAVGHVRLSLAGQVARGDAFRWRNLTQGGELPGDPAVTTTPDFQITGRSAELHRVNVRFDVKGAGLLVWGGSAEAAPKDGPADGEATWNMGPALLDPGAPVKVTWEDSMTYTQATGAAAFGGGVVVSQHRRTLECEQLELAFGTDPQRLGSVKAVGDVAVRDSRSDVNGDGHDVDCERLEWDAELDTVLLVAREGEEVRIAMKNYTIRSPRVLIDNGAGTLECPTAGQLVVKPSAGAEDGERPAVDVTWQDKMHFAQRPVPVALFRGSVVAMQGNQLIGGDTLDVTFSAELKPIRLDAAGDAVLEFVSEEPEPEREPAGEPEPATGRVPTVEGGHWLMACDALTILPAEERVICKSPGVLKVLNEGSPTGDIRWGESAALAMRDGRADFLGAVEAELSGSLLKSNSLTLMFDETRKLRHIRAEGDVFFAQQTEGAWEMRSGWAEAVFGGGNELREIIAREDVEVRDGERQLTSTILQLVRKTDPQEGKSVIDRAVAQGQVHLTYDRRDHVEAGGDRLEWNSGDDTYVLTGDPTAYARRGRQMMRHTEIHVNRTTGEMDFPPGPMRPTFSIITE